jgi:anthranilate phosphoribosyltransferase
MAGALARLGDTRRALLVSGCDGLDEVTLTGPTQVREVRGERITSWEWTPEDFGLSRCPVEALRVTGAAESARVIRAILEGATGPAADIVLANAAAALVASERAATPREGMELARRSISGGHALKVLEALHSAEVIS